MTSGRDRGSIYPYILLTSLISQSPGRAGATQGSVTTAAPPQPADAPDLKAMDKKHNRIVSRAILLAVAFTTLVSTCAASEGVILLHGLCRTERSMRTMAAALEATGYSVVNVDYPSRRATIEELAASSIALALDHPKLVNLDKIHFVTHSMGGILVRQYLKTNKIDRLGRVVMLGPPNRGSEVVDALGDYKLFELINGPAGKQLGTGSDSVPNRLGPVHFDLGVIAGDLSINWINSWIIVGPDDGKVSVERTKITGMTDHFVIHSVHPYLASNPIAIQETIYFLRNGKFTQNDE